MLRYRWVLLQAKKKSWGWVLVCEMMHSVDIRAAYRLCCSMTTQLRSGGMWRARGF